MTEEELRAIKAVFEAESRKRGGKIDVGISKEGWRIYILLRLRSDTDTSEDLICRYNISAIAPLEPQAVKYFDSFEKNLKI